MDAQFLYVLSVFFFYLFERQSVSERQQEGAHSPSLWPTLQMPVTALGWGLGTQLGGLM